MTVPVDFEASYLPFGALADPLSRAEKLLGRIGDAEPVGAVLSLLLDALRQHEQTLAREFDPMRSPLQLETAINNCCERLEALQNPDNPLHQPAPRPSIAVGGWMNMHDEIRSDCRRHGWTDQDAALAWRMGRKAMLEARAHGARWPHDPMEDTV